jgi:hypothetical protein
MATQNVARRFGRYYYCCYMGGVPYCRTMLKILALFNYAFFVKTNTNNEEAYRRYMEKCFNE